MEGVDFEKGKHQSSVCPPLPELSQRKDSHHIRQQTKDIVVEVLSYDRTMHFFAIHARLRRGLESVDVVQLVAKPGIFTLARARSRPLPVCITQFYVG